MRPYLFDILEEVCPATESSLSRVVQMLLQALLISQTRHMTVSDWCGLTAHVMSAFVVLSVENLPLGLRFVLL